jgi:hypothetical protein
MTADAMRRLRLRRAGLLPELATCTACSRQARSTRTAPLCSRCWRLSPAGREWNRLRMAAARARRSNVKNCHGRDDALPAVGHD